MIAVVQRVTFGRVVVEGRVVGEIGPGMVVLAAVEKEDTEADVDWTAGKLAGLRIFRGEDGSKHFDRDVKQIGGGILLVSNFTVAAETRTGRRPSLSGAAPPERGRELFEMFIDAVRREAGEAVTVATGRFGADMNVELSNDGPATFLVESENHDMTK